jgi:hypothetical protein
MKKFAALVAVAAIVAPASAALIISEVVDATLPGGLPKFVELTNTGDMAIDLSGYSLGNINNGATESAYAPTTMSGTLAPGDSYVCSYEDADEPGVGTFYTTYGFDADNFDFGSWINGDDVLVLYEGNPGAPHDGTGAIDVFGVVGVDGTGEYWEYTDSYAYRLYDYINGQNPMVGTEWFFAGADALETGDDAEELQLILQYTTPGVHEFVPEPASLLLLGLGLLTLRRR